MTPSRKRTAALMLLHKDQVRMGSGLINLGQHGLGGTTGLAIMTTLLQHRTDVYTSLLDHQQSALALGWDEALALGRALLVHAGEASAGKNLWPYRFSLQRRALP